jgi:hypothetical protein
MKWIVHLLTRGAVLAAYEFDDETTARKLFDGVARKTKQYSVRLFKAEVATSASLRNLWKTRMVRLGSHLRP